jgi:translocation and assembly module TamB
MDSRPAIDRAGQDAERAPRAAHRGRRIAGYVLLAVVALLVLLAAVVAWIVLTPGGTRWAVGQAESRLPALRIEQVEGTAGRGLTLRGLRYEPEQGTRVSLTLARIQLDLAALWKRSVVIEDLYLQGARVQLAESPDQEPEQPFSLEPPVDVLVARGRAEDVIVSGETGAIATIRHAELRGGWTGADGIEVEQLRVAAREGDVRLQGRLDGAAGQYRADGDASVRWQVGPRAYAGTAHFSTDDARIRVETRLTSPLAAHATGSFDQQARQWAADLRVPAVDLRADIAPDAPVGVVSAELHASGTDRTATVQGELGVDGETVHVVDGRLVLRSEPRTLHLERLVLQLNEDPGQFEAAGTFALDADPVTADLETHWREITIPEAWAGQELHANGQLAVRGSAERYALSGEIAVGPPGRLADVSVVAQGTPRRLALEKLVVQQEAGRLEAEGALDLQPQRGWSLTARARDFNPGAIFADWPGQLHLDLRTDGVVEADGPRGTVQLDELRGRLRDRRLEGGGRLEFALPSSIAGTLRLRSGDSIVRVEAEPGDALDLRARLRVADVGDFLPESRGRVNADVRVRGRWPDVRIAGVVEGNALGVASTSARHVRIEADVRNPTDPRGQIELTGQDIAAGELRFAEVRAEARGTRAEHRFTLDASGDQLDVATRISGSLAADDSWSGRVASLELGVRDDVHLDLQRPVAISYSADALELDEACLRTRREAAQVCGSLTSRADGTLRAEYRLRDVPLSLASLAAPDALPGELDGSIAGEGQVRRGVDGRWYGELALESDRARIMWSDEGPAAVAGQPLLIYEGLRAEARLDGARASGRMTAAIGGEGSITANVNLTALDTAAPRLSGRVQADLPTLDPIAPFVPKVAGLQGRVEVDARLAGTTAEPLFSGSVRAAQLAGDVPMLALQLRDGSLRAYSRTDGRIMLEGTVRSGRGRLTLDGTATRAGELDAKISGRHFVAADMEGARVVAAPDLRFTRNADGMELTGDVRIQEARINLQELPRSKPGARSVSPDVVIVNEPPPTVAEEAASTLPLTATVTVRLDEEAIELTGYGLDATVDGQLTVRDRPGRVTTASGELLVDGTYKAYGQDLTIREGEVRYAGTPVDNPRLRIEAVREVDDVIAGLRITGSAQDPQIDVFSDPSLGETDALAYLVTGRPMSAIGTAGEGDSDLMQEASQSLGTAAGGLLAKRLGQRLGIDEFGIAKSEEIGGAALTIGQYLSPRLYVGFGVGLFDPGQLVTLRYDVSESVSVEAVTSDETTRAGVDYRVER